MTGVLSSDGEDLLAVLRARVQRHRDEISPPYLFPDAVDEPFPGIRATTIGEVLHGVWESAHEQIVEIIDRLIDFERAETPGRTDADGEDLLYAHMRENEPEGFEDVTTSGWECPAAVNIAGVHYGCAEKSPHAHSGLHGNTDGSVIWSCGEVWTEEVRR